ncbi:MAG: RNA-binding S4 domain-containing protein [Bacteroidaceae bacterium]|nr:RNA-binding S4 domain-containing protein [Bacteroidaceae bacterium]
MTNRSNIHNEACDAGRVSINGKPAKASANVKEGDILEIAFGTRTVKAQILTVAETVKKEEAKEMYKLL